MSLVIRHCHCLSPQSADATNSLANAVAIAGSAKHHRTTLCRYRHAARARVAPAARSGRRFTPAKTAARLRPCVFGERPVPTPYRAPFRRRCTRITVIACHGPPPGNGTLRSFSSRAIARAVMPASSAKIGRSDSARCLASAECRHWSERVVRWSIVNRRRSLMSLNFDRHRPAPRGSFGDENARLRSCLPLKEEVRV
jgi:hypothetical protein